MDGSRYGHEYLDRRFKFKSRIQMVPSKRKSANFQFLICGLLKPQGRSHSERQGLMLHALASASECDEYLHIRTYLNIL